MVFRKFRFSRALRLLGRGPDHSPAPVCKSPCCAAEVHPPTVVPPGGSARRCRTPGSCASASTKRGPDCLIFLGRQWQQQYDAVCFMVLVCLQGGGPPVNCRSPFSNRGERFWIDMFGNGFFRSPCRPVVWKGCWSFLRVGSLGKVISGSGREPCGGGGRASQRRCSSAQGSAARSSHHGSTWQVAKGSKLI
jgi:hypothetical protein